MVQTRAMKEYDYKHSPLIDGQFRLLNLHPGQGSADLESNLVVRSLGGNAASVAADWDGHPLPAPSPEPYEALSYTWGPPTQQGLFVKILSDSRAYCIPIRSNLESGLRELRSPRQEKFFWIDALCINQKDDDEKSAQISAMWEIYNRADNVCIWLGTHEEDSARAMDFIKDCLNFENFERLVQDPLTSANWAALSNLMRRPWFSRRWIVQEIALARTATLHCGETKVPWQDFADAISLFHSKQHEIRKLFRESASFHNHPDWIGDVTELGAMRLVDASANIFRKSDDGQIMEHMLSLEALMSMLSAFEATDPHDTIYAILWLAHDARPISKTEHSFFGEPRNDYSPGPSTPLHSPMLGAITSDSPPNIATNLVTTNTSVISLNLQKRASLNSHREQAGARKKLKSAGELEVPAFHLNDGDQEAELPVSNPNGAYRSSVLTGSITETNTMSVDASLKAKELSISTPITTIEKRQPNTNLNIPGLSDKARRIAAKLTRSVREKRITVDYRKSVFEVCRDFLAFTINRSHSLDMICLPWAPYAPDLPSWIPQLSGKAFGLSINKAYRRVNADPLVGTPGSGRRHYNAAPKTAAAPIPSESTDRNLIVKGFAFDMIKKKNFPATAGIIPSQWLQAGGWADTSSYPPDQFWRTLVGNRDSHGQRPPAHWMRACKDAFNRRPAGSALDTKELLMYDCPAATRNFIERVQCTVWERRLVILNGPPRTCGAGGPQNSLALAAVRCKKGDLVCILFGCSVPVLLRKFVNGKAVKKPAKCDCQQVDCNCDLENVDSVRHEKGKGDQSKPNIHYEFIGECYAYGMMDGEAFRVQKEKELKYEMFDLR